MDKIIAFIKETPNFVEKYKNGGQFNGYLLISKEYSNINLPEPHGGITLKITDPKRIKKFIISSTTFWEYGNLEHPNYSKYFCVGFDTLHYGDSREYWTMENVWKETRNWKLAINKKILKIWN